VVAVAAEDLDHALIRGVDLANAGAGVGGELLGDGEIDQNGFIGRLYKK
jgi:hypothetical protein